MYEVLLKIQVLWDVNWIVHNTVVRTPNAKLHSFLLLWWQSRC